MEKKEIILKRLQLEIKKNGETQKEICIKLGLNPNFFQTMKQYMPQLNNLIKVAEYLDISIDYLLGRTDNSKSHKQ